MKHIQFMTSMGLAAAVALVCLGAGANSAWGAHSDRSCSNCHVPHTAASDQSVPLWNPEHTTTTLTDHYASDTLDATTSAPDGASKLCLSCHDGSYSRVSDAHAFASDVRPAGGMGSLENSHPISFVFDSALAVTDGELVDPSTLASDVLDTNDKMQCISCHDIHSTAVPDVQTAGASTPEDETDDVFDEQPYLRWPYYSGSGVTSAFCRNCHVK